MLVQRRFLPKPTPPTPAPPVAAPPAVAEPQQQQLTVVVAEEQEESAADTGWAPQTAPLIILLAKVLEGRPNLCHTFWLYPPRSFLAKGSASSMLLHARYPLMPNALPTLLAALCSPAPPGTNPAKDALLRALNAESTKKAWRFARSLRRACHYVPSQLDHLPIAYHSNGRDLLVHQPIRRLGTPPLDLSLIHI